MSAPTTSGDALRRVLQKYWGYDGFLPVQREAMESVLHGRDSLVVLPTGGGKSLCFQAPALCWDGLAVVVSPLISLMKDQVDALRACGVPAACVNSTLSFAERRRVADDIRAGRLRLLYAAPERLLQERTLDFLKRVGVSFVAIDEAHCISQWGHDFRPEYRELRILKDAFPEAGLHAYTATATRRVREDIVRQLGLREPDVLVGTFDRPNLVYRVKQRSNRLQQVRDVLDRHRDESGIIYCISRRDVDETAAALQELGYRALPYHAGLSDDERKDHQQAFIEEKIEAIVATVAFGMGIDKPNVRYVIHAGMPKSLEHYQQENGRAGRDGLEAECWLFYTGGDAKVWRKLLKKSEGQGFEGAMEALGAMQDYCSGVVCRHRVLTEHFGQAFDRENCGACDVCLGELDLVDDSLQTAQKILSCVVRLKEKFGADYTARVLKGLRDERIRQRGHENLSTWGLLEQETLRTIRDWIEQLVGQKCLKKTGEYSLLQVTEDGWRVLRGETAPRLLKPRTRSERDAATRQMEDSWEGVDEGLFEALRGLRRQQAEEEGVPPYMVFSDATLRDMARVRPSTQDGFGDVHGIGEKKQEDYGEEFVAFIADYCRQHGIATDQRPATAKRSSKSSTGPSASALKAFAYFRQGMPVEEVAQQMDRAVSTTTGYLTQFLRHEQVRDPSPWVDAETAQRVRQAVEQMGDGRLKPIFEHLGGGVSYEAIRVVVECWRNEGKVDE